MFQVEWFMAKQGAPRLIGFRLSCGQEAEGDDGSVRVVMQLGPHGFFYVGC